jgi:hypothetical protein
MALFFRCEVSAIFYDAFRSTCLGTMRRDDEDVSRPHGFRLSHIEGENATAPSEVLIEIETDMDAVLRDRHLRHLSESDIVSASNRLESLL